MSTRGIAKSYSPGSTLAATGTARPATTWPGSCVPLARRRDSGVYDSRRSRSITSPKSSWPHCRELGAGPPSARAAAVRGRGVSGAMRPPCRRPHTYRVARRSRRTSTYRAPVAVVGFPGEERGLSPGTPPRRSSSRRRRRHRRLPVLAEAGVREDDAERRSEAGGGRRGARVRELSRVACLARWREKIGAAGRAGGPAGGGSATTLALARRAAVETSCGWRPRSDGGGDPRCLARRSDLLPIVRGSPRRDRRQDKWRPFGAGHQPEGGCICWSCKNGASRPSGHIGYVAEEAKHFLDFIAETARLVALDEYRLMMFVGAGAGQTVFHVHMHLLGGTFRGLPA